MKGNPMQRNFGTPFRQENNKRTMSLSDEQTLKDNQNLENAANRSKQGGIGDKTLTDQKSTEKSRKRQAVIEAQSASRKELLKNAKGSKLKKFFTSTKKLKSEVTAQAHRDAKGKQPQALRKGAVTNQDKYSGVTES